MFLAALRKACACRWSYCSSTGRPLFFTTASIKKRKLSQDPPLDHEPSEPASTSTANDRHRTPDPPRLSSPPPSVGSRASASPPRFIPPYLRNEVLEPVVESDGSPCENTASGASSPSEAYAGLSLESKPGNRRGSPAGSEQTQLRTVTSAEAAQSHPRPSVAPSPSRRSVSPAKRSATEMAGENDSREQMEAENGITRGTSVDMLREEQNKESGSVGSSETTSTSVNESNTASTTATSDAAQSPQPSKEQPATSKSIDEQVSQIWALHQKEIQEGQKGYIVSMWWLSRVLARSSNDHFAGLPFDKSRLEGEIGPINNDNILDEGTGILHLTKLVVQRADLSLQMLLPGSRITSTRIRANCLYPSSRVSSSAKISKSSRRRPGT